MDIKKRIEDNFSVVVFAQDGPDKGRSYNFKKGNLTLLNTENPESFLVENKNTSDDILIEYFHDSDNENQFFLKTTNRFENRINKINYYFEFFGRTKSFQYSYYDKVYYFLDGMNTISEDKFPEFFEPKKGKKKKMDEAKLELEKLVHNFDDFLKLDSFKNKAKSFETDPFRFIDYLFSNYKPAHTWKQIREKYK